MTRVTRVTVDRSCAICERTLLMGENAIRFSPNGGNNFVDVCPLCAETAVEYGWLREGARRRRSFHGAQASWQRLVRLTSGTRPRDAEVAIVAEPILRRSDHEQHDRGRRPSTAAVPAHGRRNRQVARHAAGLDGPLRCQLEVVITVAWEIRGTSTSLSRVGEFSAVEGRGHDPADLEASFTSWNAHMEDDGRLVPDARMCVEERLRLL
jgi:hypothetical protein